MNITRQETNYECGICVLNSVYEYLYKQKINKETIIDNFILTSKGISIYDLESLANKININLMSYEISFSELKQLNYSNYFITIFQQDSLNHYVICKKEKNYFLIFDSLKGKYKMYFDEFEKYYNNIFISFDKKLIEESVEIKDIKSISFFDLPNQTLYLCLQIFLELLVILLSFLGSNFLKISINFLNQNIFSDFVFISLYFGFVFVLENLINLFINLIRVKKIEELSKRNIIFYLNYLTNKSKIFFYNTPQNVLYQYPIDIGRILKFKYVDKPSFISEIINCVVLLIILGYYSLIFLIFISLYSLVTIIYSYFSKRYNEQNYDNNNYLKNEIELNFLDLYYFLGNEKNLYKQYKIVEKCKNNFWKGSRQTIKNSTYYSSNAALKNSIQKIIYTVMVAICIYIIANQKSELIKDVSELVFLITLLNLFNSSCNNIFDFISFYPEYKKSKVNLESFLKAFNKKEYTSLINVEIEQFLNIELKNLSFKYENDEFIFKNNDFEFKQNTLIIGKNGSGKSTLLKLLSFDLPTNDECLYLINGNDIKDINSKKLEEKILYIPNNAIVCDIPYSEILYMNQHIKKEISDFLKMTKISNKKSSNLSSGEKQLTNLFALLNERNKLILLDETFTNISDKNFYFFMKNIYPTIKKNNFIIAVSHDKKLLDFFDHVLCLDE